MFPADDQTSDDLAALVELYGSLVRRRRAARRFAAPAIGGADVDRDGVESKLASQACGETAFR